MPSGGFAMSLCEPVLLVDSRMPYGAVNKSHVWSFRKADYFTIKATMVPASLGMKNLRSVMMESKRVAFFHTGLDASDTITSIYMSSVPYCRRLALMFSSGPRHF